MALSRGKRCHQSQLKFGNALSPCDSRLGAPPGCSGSVILILLLRTTRGDAARASGAIGLISVIFEASARVQKESKRGIRKQQVGNSGTMEWLRPVCERGPLRCAATAEVKTANWEQREKQQGSNTKLPPPPNERNPVSRAEAKCPPSYYCLQGFTDHQHLGTEHKKSDIYLEKQPHVPTTYSVSEI